MRKAVIRVPDRRDPQEFAETVRAYLPPRYHVDEVAYGEVVIAGEDYLGWTFEEYVAPRLSSGLMRAAELVPMDPAKLNGEMEMNHVIRVHEGGAVSTPQGVWAPEVCIELDEDGQVTASGEEDMIASVEGGAAIAGDGKWEFMRGYTGQYMSAGSPVMHPSEYIGGRLAADILERPGLYVACEVTGMYPTEEAEDEGSDDPIGWVVLRRDTEPPTSHGILYDYKTGMMIRPATAAELARTEAKLASGDSDAWTGAWRDHDGRSVYVSEPGESPLLSWSALWTRLVTAGVHPDNAQEAIAAAGERGSYSTAVGAVTLTITREGESRYRLVTATSKPPLAGDIVIP